MFLGCLVSVSSIGGVVGGLEGDFYAVSIPSRYLKAELRNMLCLHRLRIKTKTDLDGFIPKLNDALKGLRSEVDFENDGCYLITFPYRNDKEKRELNSIVSKIVSC